MHIKYLFDRYMMIGASLGLALGLLWLVFPAIAQEPTQFSYQGRLLKDGDYLSGTCDFITTIYDQPTGGTDIASPPPHLDVPVSGGFFTLVINTGVITPISLPAYLSVQVRCGTEQAYTPLDSQRIPIRSGPSVLYSPGAIFSNLSWTNILEIPADFADGVDNIISYTVRTDTGLRLSYLSPYSGELAVDINSLTATISAEAFQRRVTGTCLPADSKEAIQSINADGSVTCGTATIEYLPSAAEGVLVTDNNELFFNPREVQQRIRTCEKSNSGIQRINEDGTVVCVELPQGSISDVVAEDGLEGGGAQGIVSLSIADGGPMTGISEELLADGSITTEKIDVFGVAIDKIAEGAITTEKIQNGTLTATLLTDDDCTDDQALVWVSGISSWDCRDIETGMFIPVSGSGITITGNIVAAVITTGLTFDGGELALDYPPTGNPNGTSTMAARSNHRHDNQYVAFARVLTQGDVLGSFQDGLTVAGIAGHPIQGSLVGDPVWLKYDVEDAVWQLFEFDTAARQISLPATENLMCEADETLVGGGCECDASAANLVISKPTGNGWQCGCANDDTPTTFAICLDLKGD